ncbi:MAG: putative transposase [Actinomycetota bacterium]|nr:putative transposase [Actinomycetota bacterium]
MLRRPLEFAQFTSITYTQRLADAGIEPSVGSRGDSYDNALAESEIGLFKTELIRRRGPWRTPEQVELATMEWVDWFNNRRLHGSIGHIPRLNWKRATTLRGNSRSNRQSLYETQRGSFRDHGWHPSASRDSDVVDAIWRQLADQAFRINARVKSWVLRKARVGAPRGRLRD